MPDTVVIQEPVTRVVSVTETGTVTVQGDRVTVVTVGTQGPPGPQGPQGDPGPAGPSDHALLTHLDYASANHTGFAGTGVANTFTAGQTITNSTGLALTVSPVGKNPGGITYQGAASNTVSNPAFRVQALGDSATTVTIIRADGSVGVGYGSASIPGRLTVQPKAASQVGEVVRGFASQTANLTEWQNSGGSTVASVGATGGITAASVTAPQGAFTASSGGNTPLTITGAASQTADLQVWQDEAGTTFLRVTAAGELAGMVASLDAVYAGQIASSDTISASTGIYTPNIGDVAGTVSVSFDSGVMAVTGTETITSTSASDTPLTVKGAAGQTADLVKFKDSSGADNLVVNYNGTISHAGIANLNGGNAVLLSTGGVYRFKLFYDGQASFGANTSLTDGQLNVESLFFPARPTAVFKGVTSQTADILVVKNSVGTVMDKISPSGVLTIAPVDTSATGTTNAIYLSTANITADGSGNKSTTIQSDRTIKIVSGSTTVMFGVLGGMQSDSYATTNSSGAFTTGGLTNQNGGWVQWADWPVNPGFTTRCGMRNISNLRLIELSAGSNPASAGLPGATFCSKPYTPSQITSNQNNYSPEMARNYRLWTDATSRTITGWAPGQDGQEHRIVNAGGANVVLANESASSTSTYRFRTNTGADITLAPNEVAGMLYDSADNRWRIWKY